MTFMLLDHKIWVRNYQLVFDAEGASNAVNNDGRADPVLVEIGPRFVLHPVRIMAGSFSGNKVYQNQHFVNPNITRRMLRGGNPRKQRRMNKRAQLEKRMWSIYTAQRKKKVHKDFKEMYQAAPASAVFQAPADG